MAITTTIKSISLGKLNNAEHIDFHNNVEIYFETATAAKLSCTPELAAAYAAALNAEREYVKRQQASLITADITAADADRDAMLAYLFSLVDTAAKSPIAKQKSAGTTLRTLVKPYRGIGTDSLGQESAEISGLLNTLNAAANATAVTAVAMMADTIEQLEALNARVVTLMSQRTAETPSRSESLATRAQSDNLYAEITQKAGATCVIAPTAEATTFVTNINNQIDKTRNAYNIRMGMAEANKPIVPPTPPVTTDGEQE